METDQLIWGFIVGFFLWRYVIRPIFVCSGCEREPEEGARLFPLGSLDRESQEAKVCKNPEIELLEAKHRQAEARCSWVERCNPRRQPLNQGYLVKVLATGDMEYNRKILDQWEAERSEAERLREEALQELEDAKARLARQEPDQGINGNASQGRESSE